MGAPRWNIETHEMIDSTSTRAAALVRAAFAEGKSVHRTAVIAARQSAGRGQHGRTWESPPGGLYLSAVLEKVPVALRPLLPLNAGMAIIDGLEACGYRGATIRWPNDVLLDDRKVAGVLCESVAQGERWAAIVGIGVNVQLDIDSLPPTTRRTATSLHLHNASRLAEMADGGERARYIQKVMGGVLVYLERDVFWTGQRGAGWSLDRMRARDALRGKAIAFQLDERVVEGVACGIGDGGELLIEIDHRVEAFSRGTLLAVDGAPLRSS